MSRTIPTPDALFQAAQQPAMWLRCAKRLRDAAELILTDQRPREVAYFRAVDDASNAAAALLATSGSSTTVEVEAEAPNYLPAQLLYALAIQNALKGLIVLRSPKLADPRKFNKSIANHDLLKLAQLANIALYDQEAPLLRALSQITMWAGRYPVALSANEYVTQEHPMGINPMGLLDWGSQHPFMRNCFDRLAQTLLAELPKPPVSKDVVVALKPDTH